MKTRLILLLLLAALMGAAFTPAVAQDAADDKKPAEIDEKSFAEQQKANVAVLDRILAIIRDGFYDRYAQWDGVRLRSR